jgi:hypothetical protein
MIDTLVHNKIAIAFLSIIVIVGAWYFLGGTASDTKEGLVTETFSTPESEADRDLVATLLQLRAVTLEGTVFNDPVFQSLRDFGSQIVKEDQGRENPFAPLSQTASAGTRATSTRGTVR